MGTSAALKTVQKLIENNEDYEWFPTTDAMINIIKSDIDENVCDYPSVIDCGAGDGRVLKALTKGDKYAIEKANVHIESLDKDIFIVGTEFREQTLMDKSNIDILFCNPPYRELEDWTKKIIREANTGLVYLILPTRWKLNTEINDLIKARSAKVEILGESDFLEGDRAARAEVDIIKITLKYSSSYNNSIKQDPFELWFETNFSLNVNKDSSSEHTKVESTREKVNKKVKNELVEGTDLISALEKLYQRDLKKIINTYQKLMDVDADILQELDVNLNGVMKALKLKISSLKDIYWNELFNNLEKITRRLTASSRKVMLNTLTSHTHVDFTVSNARAIIIWVIKNSNDKFDQQLIETVEHITEKASITLYKSNLRTFGREDWRYSHTPENLDHYGLDYRFILMSCGGLSNSTFYSDNVNGLSTRAADIMNDICIIAYNLGFDTFSTQRANDFNWESNKGHKFEFYNHKTGENDTLFEVKAFLNGNLHFRFNQAFIRRLNVKFGQLKGWIKSPHQAADELDIPIEEAVTSFSSNKKIEISQPLLLSFI